MVLIGWLAGLVIGAVFGALVMALCVAAGGVGEKSDREPSPQRPDSAQTKDEGYRNAR